MKVDTNGINNKVKPKLSNASSYLNRVASSISSLDIPSSFGCAGTLRSMSQEASNISNEVENINRWASDVVSKFQAAESKSSSAINSLLGKLDMVSFGGIGATAGKIAGTAASMALTGGVQSGLFKAGFDLAQSVAKGVQKGLSQVGAKISSTWKSLFSTAKKTGVKLVKETKAKVSKIVTGAINEVSKGINKVEKGITDFAKKGYEKACQINQSIENGLNEAASHVGTAWNSFCTEVVPQVGEALQSAAASVSNVVLGLAKGIGQFGESLGDLALIVETGVQSTKTGLADAITYIGSVITGNTDEWESMTAKMWKQTMAFVAEDHVGNAFKDFYENTAVGKWLDEHAIDACKSDGIVTNISSGLGYVAGVIVLTVATLGAGTALTAGASGLSFAATSAGIAAAAGTGKYTQEAWGAARDSSWEGIQKLYQEGEITKDEFDTFVTIRNLTDEQWEEIKNDYQAGKISKEEFEQIEQIREMPEDWKTFENGVKGLLYGAANGAWEGVQWYVGGKLGNWTLKGGSKLGTSAIRVGADTAFNGFDTPFRTAITAITNGKTWDEAWKEQGGWQSVLTNIGVGLIGSAGGEVFDYKMPGKTNGNMKFNNANIDEETIRNVIDPEHGFQLNIDDMGDFYKANIKNGFFSSEQIQNMLKQVNEKGYIDEITGQKLKNLFNGNSDIYIKTVNSADVDSIMDEGIRCLGNSTSGGNAAPNIIENIDLGDTMTKVTGGGLYELLLRLKNSNGLSQGNNPIDGAMIIEIPKGSSLEDILKFNPELGIYNLDPKYNLGFIGCDKNGILDGNKFLQTAGNPQKVNINSEISDEINLNQVQNGVNSSQTVNSLEEAIKRTLDKYGDRTSREYIMQELNKGNFSVITGDYGARNFVKTYFAENQQMLNDFISVIGTGKKSDPQMINWMSSVLEKELANGNTEVRKFISKYIELKAKYPKLRFEIDANNGCYWNINGKVLKLGANRINDAGKCILFHESGHLLFSLVGKEKIPDNYIDIMNQARVISSNNNTLSQVGETFCNIDHKMDEIAISNIDNWVKSQGYNTIDDYIASMAIIIDNNKSKLFTVSNLRKLGLDEKIIDIVKKSNKNVSSYEIMTKYINSLICENSDNLYRTQYDYATAISDIIDAVYLSKGEDIYGNEIYTPYSHRSDKKYYTGKKGTVTQLHELIANFSSLKALNHNQALADLKTIFGEDFYNMLDELYNSFFE